MAATRPILFILFLGCAIAGLLGAPTEAESEEEVANDTSTEKWNDSGEYENETKADEDRVHAGLLGAATEADSEEEGLLGAATEAESEEEGLLGAATEAESEKKRLHGAATEAALEEEVMSKLTPEEKNKYEAAYGSYLENDKIPVANIRDILRSLNEDPKPTDEQLTNLKEMMLPDGNDSIACDKFIFVIQMRREFCNDMEEMFTDISHNTSTINYQDLYEYWKAVLTAMNVKDDEKIIKNLASSIGLNHTVELGKDDFVQGMLSAFFKRKPKSNENKPASNKTEPESNKTEPESNKTEPESNENKPASNKTESEYKETEPESNKTESESKETEPESKETEPESNKTEPEYNKTESESNKTEPESNKTESESKETTTSVQ